MVKEDEKKGRCEIEEGGRDGRKEEERWRNRETTGNRRGVKCYVVFRTD